MNLGELIKALEGADQDLVVPWGFHQPHSYRGYYEQLAFRPTGSISVADMLAAAKSALGATFQGYKGGYFTMDEYTECWIAAYGESDGETIGQPTLRYMLAHASLTAENERLRKERDEARAEIFTLANSEDGAVVLYEAEVAKLNRQIDELAAYGGDQANARRRAEAEVSSLRELESAARAWAAACADADSDIFTPTDALIAAVDALPPTPPATEGSDE